MAAPELVSPAGVRASGPQAMARKACLGLLFSAAVVAAVVLQHVSPGGRRGGARQGELAEAAAATAAVHGGLSSIIKQTKLQMNTIRHAPVHAWDGKEVKQEEEDLLKSALVSQRKDSRSRFQHSSEHQAAVDKDHGHIPTKLARLAKQAKALQEHDGQKEAAYDASGQSRRDEHLAEDLNHGRVSKKQLSLAVKLAHEMHKEGDVARRETWEGGANEKMMDAAEDKDHGKVTNGMLKTFEQAMDEQQHNGPLLARRHAEATGSAKVLLAAERERQKDTMLSMQHERS